MSERRLISSTASPETRTSLFWELKKLGLYEGMTVIVHSSLKSVGWICGGSVSFIQALMDVITPSGNIIMATHTQNYSDPSEWENPSVPEEWWKTIRSNMPAYQEEITPSYGMGIVAETFRKWPGVYRSKHPQVSFAAWGKNARDIVEGHQMDYGLGEGSPLGKIYNLNGFVLLVGVGYDKNSSFHLSEYRAPIVKIWDRGAPVIDGNERVWKVFRDIELNTGYFNEIGLQFEAEETVVKGFIGHAETRLFSQRRAVDFAEKWIEAKRKSERSGSLLSPL